MDINVIRRQNLKKLIGDTSRRGAVSDFARLHGFDPTYLRQLLSDHRSIGEKSARNIEAKTNQPNGWLDVTSNIGDSLRPSAPQGGRVPLVSAMTATKMLSNKNKKMLVDSADILEYRDTSAVVGPRSFAIKSGDDSMFSAGSPASISIGMIVIIDPDVIPVNGNIVAASVAGGPAILKRLVIDGPNSYLVPANQAYKAIPFTDDTVIIGRAVRIEIDI